MKAQSRKRRFGLKTLLALFAIVCAVLGLFYPRVYCATTLKLTNPPIPFGVQAPSSAKTYKALALTLLLPDVLGSDPDIAKFVENKPEGWLADQLNVTNLDDDHIKIRLVGRPPERSMLRKLADAFATAIIEFEASTESEMAGKATALIEQAKIEISQEFDRAESGKARERIGKLLNAANARLDEIEAAFMKDSHIPAVVSRSTGIAF